jgi:nicotinamide-nucleotide amidase
MRQPAGGFFRQAPKAAIVVIGTELTLGRSSETNSEILGRWLTERGYEVLLVLKLPDDKRVISAELRRVAGLVRVIIATGGLGPTHDDLTREALAMLLDKPLIPIESFKERLERAVPTGADRSNFLKQASRPEGTRPIEAELGTAPGIAADFGGAAIYALPGVPQEMESMLHYVAADLTERVGEFPGFAVARLGVAGVSEPALAGLMKPVIEAHDEIFFNILSKPQGITVTLITLTEAGRSRERLDQAVSRLHALLGHHVYAQGEESLPSVVGKALTSAGATLGVAESLTGGRLGQLITSIPGSARYFRGGVTAYHNDVKQRLLGVPPATLAEKGAVSPETALAMAEGAARATGADMGLSLTGIAGPDGGTAEKPVGLVYIGLYGPRRPQVLRFLFHGDRTAVQEKAAFTALNGLRLYLQEAEPPGVQVDVS